MNSYLAQVDFGALAGEKTPGLAGKPIGAIINIVLTLFFPIATIALLAMLIMAGYQYMVSSGDPKLTAKAQSGITYAIVGFIIIFAAYFVTNYFGYVLQISQIFIIFGG